MTPGKSDSRWFFHYLVKPLSGGIVLWFVIDYVRFDEITAAFGKAHPAPILLALLLLVPNIGLQFLKWRVLVVRFSPEKSNLEIAGSLLTGFAVGFITPARIGEFGGRAFSLSGVSRVALIGLTGLDKLASMLVTISLGAVGFILFLLHTDIVDDRLISVASILVFACGFPVLIVLKRRYIFRIIGNLVRRNKKLESIFRSVLRAFEVLTFRDALKLLIFSFLFYVTFIVQFVVLLFAFGEVNVYSALIGIMSIMLAKTLIPPITLGELGIRESASVYFLTALGFAGAAAFNASLLLFVMNILLPAIAGGIVLFRFPQPARVIR